MKGKKLRLVSVVGSGDKDPELYETARSVGRLLAENQCVVVTGGLAGVMEGASRGATEAGGLTIGFLPGRDATKANPWVGIAIPTGLGEARNVLVATAGSGMIAVGGEVGTLSEVAFALKRTRLPSSGAALVSLPRAF